MIALLPPLICLALALITRRVLLSLTLGVFSGGLMLNGWNPLDAGVHFYEGIADQLVDVSHLQVIGVVMVIGGFSFLLEESGGAAAFANRMVNYIRGPKQAQFYTWLGGLGIFFTDTANSLILGPLFRPIYRKYNISKEKLAFILDSTSAPICILIPFISWGVYIISLIDQSYTQLGINESGYQVFNLLLPYQFYPLLALVSVPAIIWLGKDFGPMKRAQDAYRESEAAQQEADPSNGKSSVSLILVPLLVLFITMGGAFLYVILESGSLGGEAVNYSLLAAYLAASISAMVIAARSKMMAVNESLKSFVRGIGKVMAIPFILILAWALGDLCDELGTGKYLASLIGDHFSSDLLPLIVFLLGSVISFAIGSSWGTMAILMPIAISVGYNLGAPIEVTIAAVLSGALFGDHTSPISDTTLLASLGADCRHIDHVNTQLVYALVSGGTAALLFWVAGWFTVSWLILPGLVLLPLLLFLLMRWANRGVV